MPLAIKANTGMLEPLSHKNQGIKLHYNRIKSTILDSKKSNPYLDKLIHILSIS